MPMARNTVQIGNGKRASQTRIAAHGPPEYYAKMKKSVATKTTPLGSTTILKQNDKVPSPTDAR